MRELQEIVIRFFLVYFFVLFLGLMIFIITACVDPKSWEYRQLGKTPCSSSYEENPWRVEPEPSVDLNYDFLLEELPNSKEAE